MSKFKDRFARQNPVRASTRVSSGFTLLTHSSLSFGSRRVRSDSTRLPRKGLQWASVASLLLEFHTSSRFRFGLKVFITLPLAHTPDSLVRVSRRVDWGHSVHVLLLTKLPSPTSSCLDLKKISNRNPFFKHFPPKVRSREPF